MTTLEPFEWGCEFTLMRLSRPQRAPPRRGRAVRDALRAERRRLPWVKIDKPYVFEGPKANAPLLTCSVAKASLPSITMLPKRGIDR